CGIASFKEPQDKIRIALQECIVRMRIVDQFESPPVGVSHDGVIEFLAIFARRSRTFAADDAIQRLLRIRANVLLLSIRLTLPIDTQAGIAALAQPLDSASYWIRGSIGKVRHVLDGQIENRGHAGAETIAVRETENRLLYRCHSRAIFQSEAPQRVRR